MILPDFHSDNDVRLMLDFKSGNISSFERLMEKYFPRLVNFIYRYTGELHTAEDLAQEVFMRVYKSSSNYSPKAQFKTWLYTIARNVSLNELRKNKHITSEMVSQAEDTKRRHPDESALRDETIQSVKRAIGELPEKQRIAVILRRYDGLSYGEIAGVMKTSEKAVKSLLSRAKENLRAKLLAL